MTELAVHFDYPVVFTNGVLSADNSALVDAIARKEPARRHRILVTIERAVAEAWPQLAGDAIRYAERWPERLELVSPPSILEGTETCKASMAGPLAVAERLSALAIDRQSYVVIVGGGAFLDMVGFAAAITHRGVRVVRIPTTVLSQADSGVGVKNGINAFGKKNFLGAFAPPWAVINDGDLLSTLPKRDRIAGMSEAVKVALIRDAAFFEWLSANARALATFDPAAMDHMIRRSAELHLTHIATAGDPFELGTARPLDFGHWSAHKLETLTGYEMRHGEAVAIGIALDTFYAVEHGDLDRAALDPIVTTLDSLGFSLWDDRVEAKAADGSLALLEGLREFREHLGGELTITLLSDIGRGFDTHAIEPQLVRDGIDWLRRRR